MQIQAQLQLTASLSSYRWSESAVRPEGTHLLLQQPRCLVLVIALRWGHYAASLFHSWMSAKQCSLTPISLSGGFYRQAAKKIRPWDYCSFRCCFHMTRSSLVHTKAHYTQFLFAFFSYYSRAVTQLLIQGKVMRLLWNPVSSFPSTGMASW